VLGNHWPDTSLDDISSGMKNASNASNIVENVHNLTMTTEKNVDGFVIFTAIPSKVGMVAQNDSNKTGISQKGFGDDSAIPVTQIVERDSLTPLKDDKQTMTGIKVNGLSSKVMGEESFSVNDKFNTKTGKSVIGNASKMDTLNIFLSKPFSFLNDQNIDDFNGILNEEDYKDAKTINIVDKNMDSDSPSLRGLVTNSTLGIGLLTITGIMLKKDIVNNTIIPLSTDDTNNVNIDYSPDERNVLIEKESVTSDVTGKQIRGGVPIKSTKGLDTEELFLGVIGGRNSTELGSYDKTTADSKENKNIDPKTNKSDLDILLLLEKESKKENIPGTSKQDSGVNDILFSLLGGDSTLTSQEDVTDRNTKNKKKHKTGKTQTNEKDLGILVLLQDSTLFEGSKATENRFIPTSDDKFTSDVLDALLSGIRKDNQQKADNRKNTEENNYKVPKGIKIPTRNEGKDVTLLSQGNVNSISSMQGNDKNLKKIKSTRKDDGKRVNSDKSAMTSSNGTVDYDKDVNSTKEGNDFTILNIILDTIAQDVVPDKSVHQQDDDLHYEEGSGDVLEDNSEVYEEINNNIPTKPKSNLDIPVLVEEESAKENIPGKSRNDSDLNDILIALLDGDITTTLKENVIEPNPTLQKKYKNIPNKNNRNDLGILLLLDDRIVSESKKDTITTPISPTNDIPNTEDVSGVMLSGARKENKNGGQNNKNKEQNSYKKSKGIKPPNRAEESDFPFLLLGNVNRISSMRSDPKESNKIEFKERESGASETLPQGSIFTAKAKKGNDNDLINTKDDSSFTVLNIILDTIRKDVVTDQQPYENENDQHYNEGSGAFEEKNSEVHKTIEESVAHSEEGSGDYITEGKGVYGDTENTITVHDMDNAFKLQRKTTNDKKLGIDNSGSDKRSSLNNMFIKNAQKTIETSDKQSNTDDSQFILGILLGDTQLNAHTGKSVTSTDDIKNGTILKANGVKLMTIKSVKEKANISADKLNSILNDARAHGQEVDMIKIDDLTDIAGINKQNSAKNDDFDPRLLVLLADTISQADDVSSGNVANDKSATNASDRCQQSGCCESCSTLSLTNSNGPDKNDLDFSYREQPHVFENTRQENTMDANKNSAFPYYPIKYFPP
jgi:hypothetical protein